jgi:hypothetical protein
MLLPPTRCNQVYVYGGRAATLPGLPDFVHFFPPAKRGDLDKGTVPDGVLIVFVDGLFYQTPSVTHCDLLELLAERRVVIGAASMGALRAVELRHQGMMGIGTVYRQYMSGHLKDDSEVAEAICPYTFRPVTFATVRIRRALALAASEGVDHQILDAAFRSARAIHFLERRIERIARTWCGTLPSRESAVLMEILESPESDIKTEDACRAIDTAIQATVTGQVVHSVLDSTDLYLSPRGLS